MTSANISYTKSCIIKLPLLCLVTGIFTGCLIFSFKYCASLIINLSSKIYNAVSQSPVLAIPVALGFSLIGLALAFILKYAPDCKGGGIPTSIAILRGLISFSWIKSIFCLFAGAMLTYLGGVPLGNEGPSVQMGTAVGKGTATLLSPKRKAWDRYLMTGGACAGFACATGAPISGILFSYEEAHRRFSPLIFTVASVTVIAGVYTTQLLCQLTNTHFLLFELEDMPVMPLDTIWCAALIGLVSGLCATAFLKSYKAIRLFIAHKLSKVSPFIKIPAVFFITAISGFIISDCVSTGHGLTEKLFTGEGLWYILIIVLIIRGLVLIIANNLQITGGLFIPTIAFGAIIGSLCARFLIFTGLMPSEHYLVATLIGAMSFLAASSHIPITATVFAVEALNCFENVLPVAAGVSISFFIVEALKAEDFTDVVIENRLRNDHRGQKAVTVQRELIAQEGCFALEKEVRDILWPSGCTVISLRLKDPHGAQIHQGDALVLNCRTYDEAKLSAELENILGNQS